MFTDHSTQRFIYLVRRYRNAYLKSRCREKIWTRAGPEFGQDEGKMFIIVMVFYGLKSSGAAFRIFLTGRLNKMGFKSSISDPDLWIRPATKADGEQYYELNFVYVDYIILISQYTVSVMREVPEKFKLKKYKIQPPEVYLGG